MNLDAKVNAIINETPKADSAPDAKGGAPPSASASGTESAPGGSDVDAKVASQPSSQSPEGSPPGAPTMADLYAAKLAKVTEERKAARVLARARAQDGEARRLAAEAAEDRKAAATEKARWEGLKNGSFLETLKAAGKDPAKAFAEMQREAVEAGTPEAQMRRMREEMDRQLAETVEPLKKTIAQLTEERQRAEAQAAAHSRESDFNRHVVADAYESLRDEYPPERLYAHVDALIRNPDEFYRHQERLKVRLTTPGKGYNMEDILNVLKSVQDEHVSWGQKQRATRAGSTPSDAAPNAAQSQTVNGTRPAATTTIGNDLTTARAADGKFIPKGATAAQRIRERARRLGST